MHVFEAQDRGAVTYYKLTSTVILHLGTKSEAVGGLDLSGYLNRQTEQNLPAHDDAGQIINVGKVRGLLPSPMCQRMDGDRMADAEFLPSLPQLVEDLELKMRSLLRELRYLTSCRVSANDAGVEQRKYTLAKVGTLPRADKSQLVRRTKQLP